MIPTITSIGASNHSHRPNRDLANLEALRVYLSRKTSRYFRGRPSGEILRRAGDASKLFPDILRARGSFHYSWIVPIHWNEIA